MHYAPTYDGRYYLLVIISCILIINLDLKRKKKCLAIREKREKKGGGKLRDGEIKLQRKRNILNQFPVFRIFFQKKIIEGFKEKSHC